MDADTIKLLAAVATALAIGFGGGELSDVTGARAWREAQEHELLQTQLTMRENERLRAQVDLLLQLVRSEMPATAAALDLPDLPDLDADD